MSCRTQEEIAGVVEVPRQSITDWLSGFAENLVGEESAKWQDEFVKSLVSKELTNWEIEFLKNLTTEELRNWHDFTPLPVSMWCYYVRFDIIKTFLRHYLQ